MRILIACEFSGIVRDAFIKRGHDAWSCDILPTESPGPHIQDDVLLHLEDGWDMMIAHPPCTHLAVSGAKHFHKKEKEQHEAMLFVFSLVDAPVEKIAIENPVSVISRYYRKPDQIIQPWQFGHEESKATCLWLKNLPLLKPTMIMPESYSCQCGINFPLECGKYGCPNCHGENKVVIGHGHKQITKSGKVLPKWYSNAKGKKRSKTFQGIADAMADQWG